MQYDLSTNISLLGGQSPSNPDKHKTVAKFAKILKIKNDFGNLDDTNNVLVVDYLSLLQCLQMQDFQNFQKLLVPGWNYIKCVCKFNKLQIVFDCYNVGSLKNL